MSTRTEVRESNRRKGLTVAIYRRNSKHARSTSALRLRPSRAGCVSARWRQTHPRKARNYWATGLSKISSLTTLETRPESPGFVGSLAHNTILESGLWPGIHQIVLLVPSPD